MGFLPHNASNIERGPGFVAFEKGNQEHIIFPNRGEFARLVAQAKQYAANHGGDLPHTAFWNKAADVYDDNVKLFKREHQCGPLLKLLRQDEAFDRAHPIVSALPPSASTTPITPTRPGMLVESVSPAVEPVVVPEPASGMMLGLGVLVAYVVGRRGIGPRAGEV